MNYQKLIVISKYEKYEMLLAQPHPEGINKLSTNEDSVKDTGLSIL